MSHIHSRSAAVLRRAVEPLEDRRLMAGELNATFNFQPTGTPLAAGTIADYGNIYADRGNGYTYGWKTDSRNIMRDRNTTSDQRLDTVAQIQQGGVNHTWELAVPNGQYEVTITAGDSKYLDGQHHIDAEGVRVMYGVQSTKKQYLTVAKEVIVTDGKLTISPESSGVNSKLISVKVRAVPMITLDERLPIRVVALNSMMTETGSAQFRISRPYLDLGELTVHPDPVTVYLDWSGSASTKDFRGRPTSVTIPTYGDGTAIITIEGRLDDLEEADEAAKLTILANPAYRLDSPSSATVILKNVSPQVTPITPTVSVITSDDSASEDGNHGEYVLSRSDGNGALSVSWNWSSLASGADFQIGVVRPSGTVFSSRPNSITFENGETEIRLRLRANLDTLVEGNEHATLNLISTSAYNVGSAASASVTIADHVTAPTKPIVTVVATDAHATEGSDTATFTFTRTGSINDSLLVPLNWGGSATAGDVTRPGSVNFPAYSSTATITLAPIDDHLDESDESVSVTVVGNDVSGVGSPGSATIIIHDSLNTPTPTPGTFSNINWSTTSSPPVVLCETTSIVIDNELYLFGGFTANFKPQKVAYRFDGTKWTQLRDTPVAFTQPGCAMVDGKVWIAGGYIGKDTGGQDFGTTAVRIYDPATDTWSMGPSLPEARSTGNLLHVGDHLYFVGGETANRANDSNKMFSFDLFNPAAGWSEGPSMPLARNRAAAVVVDTRIFILGGQTGYDGGLTAHDEIQVYDTQSGIWSVAAKKLPAIRTHIMNSAQYYNGRIILVTGENAHDRPQNNVWSIDPSTLVTTALNPFPDARFTTATGIVNGKLYAIGGYRGGIATQGYVGTFI